MSQMPLPEYSFVPEFTLGDRLRRSREAVGLTQVELADAIGISQRSVSNYEADVTVPNLLTLRAWASATQVNLPWLAHGRPDSPPPTGVTWATGRRRATRPVTIGYTEMPCLDTGAGNVLVAAA
jgi:DNA-binding XRE family transcriptional regulator